MKRIIYFAAVLILSNVGAHAQIKFKDLFPTLAGMTNQELKTSLKQYISTDQDHPNANFRLALVYEKNYKTADPLTEYEYALANAEQAKLRYIKSKQLVDDREVSRNNEYYFPVFKTFDAKGKPNVEFSLVSQKITNGYDSCQLFIASIPPIYLNFTRSVNFYDKAVKEFSRLNNEFRSLEDLYLYYDADIEHRLTDLKTNYDSAHHYFDKYLALTKAYPIAYHKQSYHIKPIVTYRLDGLITRMNFLVNNIEFWDYATWVDRVKKSVSTEITSLRAKLIQNEDKLDESIKNILNSPAGDIKTFHPEKQLVFNLNNYDKQSLVLALLDYKTFKQDWLIKNKNAPDDSVNHERNAQIFSELIYSNRSADTLMEQVKVRLLPEKVRKHKDFLERYYGSEGGLKKYVNEEGSFISKTFTEYSAGLKMEVLAIASATAQPEKDVILRFGRWAVSTTPIAAPAQEQLDKGDPITLQKRKSPDGSTYLAGVYKPDKKINNSVAFLARVNPDGRPGWIKSFDFKNDSLSATSDSNNFIGPIVLTQEGVALVVRSVQISQLNLRNTFVYLNEKSEEKFNIKLKEKGFPRKLIYTEKTNSFIAAFKGAEEKQVYNANETLAVLAINTLGDQLWRRSIDFSGSLIDMINLNDGYILTGNYMVIRDNTGKEFRTKSSSGEVNPFVARLNGRGEILKINAITAGKSIFISQVIKVSDNSINLLGFESNVETGPGLTLATSPSIIHIMTNHLGERVSSNF
jgi:hypothetical protein